MLRIKCHLEENVAPKQHVYGIMVNGTSLGTVKFSKPLNIAGTTENLKKMYHTDNIKILDMGMGY